jgi:hypothetical protein
MKKLIYLFGIFLSTTALIASCNSVENKSTTDHYTDPGKYNDAIVDAQGLVIQKMTEIISLETSNEMRLMIPDFEKSIDKSIDNMKQITFHKDDYGMKEAFIDHMEFYKREVVPYVIELIDLIEEMETLSEDDEEGVSLLWNKYSNLVFKGSEMEKPYDDASQEVQNKFFEKYNLEIIDNPYMEEMDEVVEELDNEAWNEMIEGCVDGDESNRDFCICLMEELSNDYTIESIMGMSSEQMEQLGADYSIDCLEY